MALNPRLDDWSGRAVWVIGASSGIGRATSSALYRRGARVAVSAVAGLSRGQTSAAIRVARG